MNRTAPASPRLPDRIVRVPPNGGQPQPAGTAPGTRTTKTTPHNALSNTTPNTDQPTRGDTNPQPSHNHTNRTELPAQK
jgi:hypothetical protein